MYSQKWTCYFQTRIIMFCLLVHTLIYLWESYIFPGSVCLFCYREICGLFMGLYKSLTYMNVEIGTVATQFPEKEYINGIFIAVHYRKYRDDDLPCCSVCCREWPGFCPGLTGFPALGSLQTDQIWHKKRNNMKFNYCSILIPDHFIKDEVCLCC